jgi:hypothetical protein
MDRELSDDAGRSKVFSLPVIVAALGYFVDLYDLVLFSIVRVPSLKALGTSSFQHKQPVKIIAHG